MKPDTIAAVIGAILGLVSGIYVAIYLPMSANYAECGRVTVCTSAHQ